MQRLQQKGTLGKGDSMVLLVWPSLSERRDIPQLHVETSRSSSSVSVALGQHRLDAIYVRAQPPVRTQWA